MCIYIYIYTYILRPQRQLVRLRQVVVAGRLDQLWVLELRRLSDRIAYTRSP